MFPETIGRLENLKRLTIDCFSLISDDSGRVNPHNWFLDFLSDLSTSCVIRKLHLTKRYRERAEAEREVEFWQQVDRALASRRQFLFLTIVEFNIEFALGSHSELSKKDSEMLATDIRRMFFPRLRAWNQLLNV